MLFKLKINKTLFPMIIAFESMTLLYIINYTYLFGGISGQVLRLVIIMCLAAAVILDYSNQCLVKAKQLPWIVLFLIVLFISLLNDNISLLQILCTIFIFKNANISEIEQVISIDFWVKVAFTILAAGGSLAGVVYMRFVKEGVPSYGFSHVNRFGGFLLLIAIEFFILNKDRISSLIFSAFILFIEIYINCRTGMLLCLFVIMLEIIYVLFCRLRELKFGELIKKIYLYLTGLASAAVVLISYYFMVNYDNRNSIHFAVNQLLNTRLVLSNNAYENYDITLLGQMMEFVSADQINTVDNYFALDNFFVYILFVWGSLLTVIYLVTMAYFAKKIIDHRDILLMSVFLVSVLFSFMENQMLDMGMNIIILYFGYYCLNKRNIEWDCVTRKKARIRLNGG